MKNFLNILLVTSLAMMMLTACINDDYTTSSNDVLTFSADTVSFDTVVTQQGTPTKQFVVYNKSNKQVSISQKRH